MLALLAYISENTQHMQYFSSNLLGYPKLFYSNKLCHQTNIVVGETIANIVIAELFSTFI